MLILFDHGTPKGLARALPGHTIVKAQARARVGQASQRRIAHRRRTGELSLIADNRQKNSVPAKSLPNRAMALTRPRMISSVFPIKPKSVNMLLF
jgi:hypothetical protein